MFPNTIGERLSSPQPISSTGPRPEYLNHKTPCQILQAKFPDTQLISNLPPKIFGCSAFEHLYHQTKLDPRSLKCIFVGYSSTKKGYKCYCPSTRKYYTTMDVTFHVMPLLGFRGRHKNWNPKIGVTLMRHSQQLLHMREVDTPQDHTPSSPTHPGPQHHEQGIVPQNSDLNNERTNLEQADLDLSIALRKSSRSCGPYRIQDFVY